MAFPCSTCGKLHDGIPLSFAADFPDEYFNLRADERDLRAIIGSDQCVVDSERFYIRGLLEIPRMAEQAKPTDEGCFPIPGEPLAREAS